MTERGEATLIRIHPANDGGKRDNAQSWSLAELLQLGPTFLNAIFADAPPIYIAARDGELIYANPAYLDLMPDRNLLPSHRQIVRRVAATDQAVVYQEKLGRTEPLETYSGRHSPLTAPGGATIAVTGSFSLAMTDPEMHASLRHERQRFHDVIRATSDWVWETDADGCISFVSDRVTEVLGLPPSQVQGRRLIELGRFSAIGYEPNPVLSALRLRRPFRDAGFEIDDPLGTTRKFRLSGVPVFGESGHFLGYRGTATDVTAHHAAEAAARQSRSELEQALEELTNKNLQLDFAWRKAMAATQAKSEFLATMGHELRTPLNAIIGFGELMELGTFGPLPPRYHAYVEDIGKAARHLLTLINDILNAAQMSRETMRVDIEPVAVARLIADARAMIETRAASKRLDISGLVYAGNMRILADPTRALQVMINLLGNAVKFTPDGGAIGVDAREAEGRARITIWDTGLGIPADKKEVIFEKFRKAHDTALTRHQEGLGLGLALSRELCQLMRGDLTLDASSSGGSRFSVVLPLAGDGRV